MRFQRIETSTIHEAIYSDLLLVNEVELNLGTDCDSHEEHMGVDHLQLTFELSTAACK